MTDESASLTLREAQDAIAQILTRIPDSEFPNPDRVETGRDDQICTWWGGHGYYPLSMKRDGETYLEGHHEQAPWAAVEREMVYRWALRLQAGDDLTGRCGT